MSVPPAFAGLRTDANAAGCTFASASDATAAFSPFARATLFAKFSFAAFARARRCARISATRDFTDSSAANGAATIGHIPLIRSIFIVSFLQILQIAAFVGLQNVVNEVANEPALDIRMFLQLHTL